MHVKCAVQRIYRLLWYAAFKKERKRNVKKKKKEKVKIQDTRNVRNVFSTEDGNFQRVARWLYRSFENRRRRFRHARLKIFAVFAARGLRLRNDLRSCAVTSCAEDIEQGVHQGGGGPGFEGGVEELCCYFHVALQHCSFGLQLL